MIPVGGAPCVRCTYRYDVHGGNLVHSSSTMYDAPVYYHMYLYDVPCMYDVLCTMMYDVLVHSGLGYGMTHVPMWAAW